jgi:putative phosphonate metabolism protein
MNTPRYAIYFAPEPGSALDNFGRQWLGRDMSGALTEGQMMVPGVSRQRLAQLTERPRRYGMHGTFKPPFALTPSSSLEGLLAAARVLARSLAPIEIPPLQLDVIGKFIALTPEVSSAPLEALAASCVRAFEGFRQPLTPDQEEEYLNNRLTVHQEQMLEHWGYPYVMEEFRFHITLTEPLIDETERQLVMDALTRLAAPLIGQRIAVHELTVFGQPARRQPMSVIARIPFGRDKR